MVEWKTIPGYDDYLVSDTGKVWSNISNRELSLWSDECGYLSVDLTKDKKKKHIKIHRLVLLSFVGIPPKDKNDVNHIDGDKSNNNLSNLEYCSRDYNIKHRHCVLGMKAPRGRRNNTLTDYEIDEIRNMHKSKQYTLKEIRDYWNLSQGALCNIIYKCGIYKNRGSH